MQCFRCQKKISSPDQAHYGFHPGCFKLYFNVSSLEPFTEIQRKDNLSLNNLSLETRLNTSFFHGKFKKYAANLSGHAYILKMRQDEAPELPEVEYLCNKIGRKLGIPVAEFYFIDFHSDKTFVTKNFIQSQLPVDLQHIYHFRPDSEHSCEGIIQAIKLCTQRPYDVNIFIQTLLYDALIGNHDRHGRNLAFIVTSKATRLSPIYDNVSYLSLESGDILKANFNPTGKIHTKDTYEPTMTHYARELKRLGFEKEIKAFYQKIELPDIEQLINNSFCTPLMKQAIKRLIYKRFEELENEL